MEKVSRNCYKGRVISDPKRLLELAHERKSIYHKNWKVKPAAFIMGMQFSIVMNIIRKGDLFEVEKIEPTKRHWSESNNDIINKEK